MVFFTEIFLWIVLVLSANSSKMMNEDKCMVYEAGWPTVNLDEGNINTSSTLSIGTPDIDNIWGPGSNDIELGGGLNYATTPGMGWSQEFGGIYTTAYSITTDSRSHFLTTGVNIKVAMEIPSDCIIEVWDLETMRVISTNKDNPGIALVFTPVPYHRYGGYAWYATNAQSDLLIRAHVSCPCSESYAEVECLRAEEVHLDEEYDGTCVNHDVGWPEVYLDEGNIDTNSSLNIDTPDIDRIWGPGSNDIELGGGLNYATIPGVGWSQEFGGIYTTAYSITTDSRSHFLTIDANIQVVMVVPSDCIIEVWDLETMRVICTNIDNPGIAVVFYPVVKHRYGGYAWYSTNAQSNLVIYAYSRCISCTERNFNPLATTNVGPCGRGCVAKNGLCAVECGDGFETGPERPFICYPNNTVIIGDDCGKSCLENIFRNEHEVILFVEWVDLTFNPVVSAGNFSMEGMSATQTVMNVNSFQISLVAAQDSHLLLGNLTLRREEAPSTPIPVLQVSGSSSGMLTLIGLGVTYSYELTTAASVPIVIENVEILFEFFTVRKVPRGGSGGAELSRAAEKKMGTRAAATGVNDDADVENDDNNACVRHTNHPALSLTGLSGMFRNVVLEDISSGALFAKDVQLTLDSVEFKNNRIKDSGGVRSPNIRDNAYFMNSSVTIIQATSDVVVGGIHSLFFSTNPNDNTTFGSTVPSGVSILFSPKANSFSLEGKQGTFVGNFVSCPYMVKVYRDDVLLKELPLTVESPTSAYITLGDEDIAAEGSYAFQFTYSVGSYHGSTPKAVLRTVPPSNTPANGFNFIPVIIVAAVMGILAVVAVVVVIVVVVLKKKNKKEVGNSVTMTNAHTDTELPTTYPSP